MPGIGPTSRQATDTPRTGNRDDPCLARTPPVRPLEPRPSHRSWSGSSIRSHPVPVLSRPVPSSVRAAGCCLCRACVGIHVRNRHTRVSTLCLCPCLFVPLSVSFIRVLTLSVPCLRPCPSACGTDPLRQAPAQPSPYSRTQTLVWRPCLPGAVTQARTTLCSRGGATVWPDTRRRRLARPSRARLGRGLTAHGTRSVSL